MTGVTGGDRGWQGMMGGDREGQGRRVNSKWGGGRGPTWSSRGAREGKTRPGQSQRRTVGVRKWVWK